MLRPNLVVRQRHIAAVLASLAFALSMSISHQAMAACTPSVGVGIILDCAGNSSIISNVTNATGATSPNVAVRITDPTTLSNSAIVSSSIATGVLTTTNNNFGVYGIWGQVNGDPPVFPTNATEFTINNTGTISAMHAGRGLVAGIYAQGDVESFTVNNYGNITVERGPQTYVSVTAAGAVTVKPNDDAALQGTLGIAAAIYNNEEEIETEVVNNYGLIQATGQLTAGISSRANSLLIENYGTIEAVAGAGIVNAAIATYDGRIQTDGPEGVSPPTNRVVTYGKTYLDNFGTITGDIQVVEQSNISYMGALLGGIDLALTAQSNRRDSEILNDGIITGNIYLGTGNHVLTNTEDGEITGNIIVDQRRAVTAPTPTALPFAISVASRPSAEGGDDDDDDDLGETFSSYADFVAAIPDHHFELDNAAVIDGDVTVFTALSSTPSTIELRPHITGAAGIGTLDDPSLNSGYIAGNLAVGEGTWTGGVTTSKIDTTTTISPVIDYVVRDGAWYMVAQTLTGTALPTIDEDSFLVDWDIAKNANNSLVIGATVADASIVEGLSAPGIAALNGLMQGGDDEVNALGGAVQSLSEENDVRTAGEQLAPETNFATQQAAWTLNFLTGSYIDNRLAGVGATAAPNGNGGGFGAPSGLGMQQSASASQAPAGRMSLGVGTDDGRMNIGANDGRMDAGIYDDQPELRRSGAASAMWGQVFGAGLDQGERANVDGYQTHIYGAMAGADNWVTANTRLGFAGGYGNTSIDGSGDTQKNKTDIDSYLGVLYGAYKGSGWYASGRLGYAWHDYTTARYLTIPFADTATGAHSGDQYSASGEIGVPLHFMGGALTPVASLTWSQLDQSGYTEASGGGMGLTIASQENTSLSSGLGAKALIPIAVGTLLEGRAIWYHEFEDTNQQVTAAFGGGADFNAAGPGVGRDTAAVGAGLFAYAATGVSFQLNYDALLRQDFIGHTGSGRLKVEF